LHGKGTGVLLGKLHVDYMTNSFWRATNLKKDSSSWNAFWVARMNQLVQLPKAFNRDMWSWDTSYVSDMRSMFEGATSFSQNLSSCNVVRVQLIESIFCGASSFEQNVTCLG
jgi:trimeric autotransporter adhesin